MAPAVQFSVSYDGTTKIISGIACAVLLGIFLVFPHIIFGVVAILIVVLAFVYPPRRRRSAKLMQSAQVN